MTSAWTFVLAFKINHPQNFGSATVEVTVIIYLKKKNQKSRAKKFFFISNLNLSGPAVWKRHFEGALGEHQSPINILVNEAIHCSCGPLVWNNFSKLPESMLMCNDGYSSTSFLKILVIRDLNET